MSMFGILPAAGSGSRMGTVTGGSSKVLLKLPNGKSILRQSIDKLVDSGCIHGIVVAGRQGDKEAILGELEGLPEGISGEFVEGGQSRQESVYLALSALKERAEFVLVHDAARPFVDSKDIELLASYVREQGPALLGVRVKPSLKRADEDGRVVETIPRQDVWEAQTPQGFGFDLLFRAHEAAREEAFTGTDDSVLVERLLRAEGSKQYVRLLEGSYANTKITTAEDLPAG